MHLCGPLWAGLVSGWPRSSRLTSSWVPCLKKSFLIPVQSESLTCIALVWLGSHALFELISVARRKVSDVWLGLSQGHPFKWEGWGSSQNHRHQGDEEGGAYWEMQPLLIDRKEYVLGRQKQQMSITFGHSKIRFWFGIKNAVFI